MLTRPAGEWHRGAGGARGIRYKIAPRSEDHGGVIQVARGRYATDASHYQIMPVGVVAPRTMDEAERAIAIAREEGVTVLPRGGGSSQAGQTVNHSLAVDCSKHLNTILDLDVAGQRCRVQPGIVLDRLWNRVEQLALAQRYEEAASMRDRAHAFASAVQRQRLTDRLRAAGELVVRLHDTELRIVNGVLATVAAQGTLPLPLEIAAPEVPHYPHPLPRHAVDEVLCLARAIEKASYHAVVLYSDGEFSWPAAPVSNPPRLALAA